MKYQGGKTRLAPKIAQHIRTHAQTRSTYIEPFMGSGAVMAQLTDDFTHRIGIDLNEDLIQMWHALSQGWIPPTSLSEEDYKKLQHDTEDSPAPAPSALRAYAGTVCSFGGKWFGGYARSRQRTPHPQEGHYSILKRFAGLQPSTTLPHSTIDFLHGDYQQTTDNLFNAPDGPDPTDTVIYCDPPYADTTGYAVTSHSFDHAAFWATAQRWADMGAVVLVSEYSAPGGSDGWVSLWEKDHQNSLSKREETARVQDKLYVAYEYAPAELKHPAQASSLSSTPAPQAPQPQAPQSRYVMLNLSDITPYYRNPRTISAEAINAVSESLNQFGYLQPLVVDENNVLIIGHTRHSAMRRHGVQRVEVLQVTGLTAQEVDALRIADNRTGEFTSWDHDALESEFDALNSQLLNTLFPELAPADLDAIENDAPDTDSDDFVDLPDDNYNDNYNDNSPRPGTTEAVCPHCYHSWEVTTDDVIDLTQ